jgi:TonB-dependent starch-binding outer membrane protein SusC
MLIKRLLHAIFMPVFLTLSLSLLAQDRVVTGKVTDSKDATPVVGASILVKGTTVGTATNAEGNFSFSVPASGKTLVVSSVGFNTIEIDITGKSTVPVGLTATAGNLSEIVVTGYGTQRRKEVTVAISTVTAEQFNKGNVSDVAQLLQGKAAGLSIARAGVDPNGGYTIRLRGLSTLGANTQPLVVVDGQVGADLNTVDPNDIASVDILKDGSAAAIYGTRGSAGVIIITTKKGKAGTSLVSYNGAVTSETPVKFTEHMTAAEFRALGNGIDYGASTDWNEEITRTAYSQVHNLSLSGGNQQTTYSASVNYRGSQGVAIKTGFKQINGRLNLSHKTINNKLTLNLILNTTRRTSDRGFADAFKYATIYNPTAPIHSTDPLYDLAKGGYFEANLVDYSNPVAVLEQNTNEGELQRLNITGSAEYEIIKGLKFLLRYAQQTSSFYNDQYSPRTAFISRGFPVGAQFGNYQGSAREGYSYKRDDESFNQLYENTLSYEHGFNHLNMTALAGYSYQNFLNKGYSLGAGKFVTDGSGQNFAAALDVQQGTANVASYKNGYELVAFFGRLNLNWESTVFLSASLRREGSTMFGSNNTWGNFPAVSAGVDIKKLVDIDFMSSLKLRGSFGVTGALPPSPYLSLERLNSSGTYYAGGGIYNFVYAGVGNPNPDLKWERKEEVDIGLDFSLLNSRLTGSFDWYNRSTKDLIFNVTVPSPPNLYTTTWKNIGQLDNDGFEITLSYDVLKGNGFNWTTGGNFSRYHIVLTKLDESLKGSYVGATNLGTPGQEATQLTRAVEGEPIGLLYGYKFLGYDANGKFLYDDGTGKGVTADKNPPRGYIGNGLPDFEFGWNNTFKYNRFDFNFFLRGSIGHDLINTFRAFYENPAIATSYNVVNTKYFNPDLNDAQIYSSLHVEKGSFVKLDNATLGYNFSAPKQGALSYFKGVRIYLTGQNLFTITDYTGVDPEVRYQDGTNVLAPGIDRRETWVYTRSFTFGINFGF